MKIAKNFKLNPAITLSATSFISIILIDFIFKKNRVSNYFLLLLLIVSFPMYTIYQKYFDPLFFLFFFGLVNSDYLKEIVLNKKINLTFIFLYFFSFYLFSLIYYSSV